MPDWLWHPIFVNFTVALFSTAVVLFFLGTIGQPRQWGNAFLLIARWDLWIGLLLSIVTLGTGFLAMYKVPASADLGSVIEYHHNWGLATGALFVCLSVWEYLLARKSRFVSGPFLFFCLIGLAMVAYTGYLGGSLVFGHAVGVSPGSMPVAMPPVTMPGNGVGTPSGTP